MTTSMNIEFKLQINVDEPTDKVNCRADVKFHIKTYLYNKIAKPFCVCYCYVLVFCSLTDKLKDQVNYILDVRGIYTKIQAVFLEWQPRNSRFYNILGDQHPTILCHGF